MDTVDAVYIQYGILLDEKSCSLMQWVCFIGKFICITFKIPHTSDIVWYLSF